jgi:hypothetical protein
MPWIEYFIRRSSGKRRRRASNFIPPFSTSQTQIYICSTQKARCRREAGGFNFFAACLFVETNFPDSICRRRWIFQQPLLPQLRSIPLQSFRRKTPLRSVWLRGKCSRQLWQPFLPIARQRTLRIRRIECESMRRPKTSAADLLPPYCNQCFLFPTHSSNKVDWYEFLWCF